MPSSHAPAAATTVAPCPPAMQQALDQALAVLGDPAEVVLLAQFQAAYRELPPAERMGVYLHLAEQLEIAPLGADATLTDAPGNALPGDLRDPDTVDRLLKLRNALESPRLRLLRQFANVPDGVKFLVDLRADLRAAMAHHPDRPSLRLVDDDLLHLLRSWFNFGFLELVPIDWENTSAAQLEKLMAYDVVHPMSDWQSLRRRLQKDRLCYAFYHPNMPREPLVFVEVALTMTIAGSVDRLMEEAPANDATAMTTAIFYSINTTQKGLAGVSLGNSLIKTVVRELRQRYPNLQRFATLSPMPGFRRFVEDVLSGGEGSHAYQLQAKDVESLFDANDIKTISNAADERDFAGALLAVLRGEAWRDDEALQLALKGGMLRLAHHYLMREQRDGRPINSVAQFHLRNGAELYNLNHLSDTSEKGLAASFGMTANYLYDPAAIDDNRRRWKAGDLAAAPELEKMVRLGISA